MTDIASGPADFAERAQARRKLKRAARKAGLVLTAAEALRIVRRRAGRGFYYLDGDGERIADPHLIARIRALAIPPAYTDVHIAEDEHAHLQAIGRDEAGRIQHRYHPDWEKVREGRKRERLSRLIRAIPRIRAALARDMVSPRVDRTKAAACALALISESNIRVGCEVYARSHGSRGAATLLKKHLSLKGGRITLNFPGKSGKDVACQFDDPRLAQALGRIARLPGKRLLQFKGAGGKPHPICAADVNRYLRSVAGVPVTAKDLRTLAASSAATEYLLAAEPAASEAGRRRQLAQVMRCVSEQLSNTPAVARKSYVHAAVVDAFERGTLKKAHDGARARPHLRRIESTLAHLLDSRS